MITSEVTKLFKEVQTARNNKQYDIAKKLCRKILEIDSKNVKGYNELGVVMYKEMMTIKNQIIRGISDARVEEIKEKIEILHSEADECFRNAIKFDPKYVDSYFNLGKLKVYYEMVSTVDRAHLDIRNSLIFYNSISEKYQNFVPLILFFEFFCLTIVFDTLFFRHFA